MISSETLTGEVLRENGIRTRIRRCAAQNNITMDACLGLYDDYYGLYVPVGQISAP